MDCSLFTNMGKTDKGDRETGRQATAMREPFMGFPRLLCKR